MNTQVLVKEETSVPEIQNESRAVLAMIERVALNPDADIEKLERMLDMQERILNRNARQEFASALAQLQAELPEVDRLAKADKSMYAKFEHILAAIRPHLINHGFAITHRCNNTDGKVSITAVLSHRGGHSEETSISLPADTSGSKNAVQAIGSSMEYGRRYTMNALLGIATRNADDDGGSYHEPDGLSAAIESIRSATTTEELQSVFGAAWKRYKDKVSHTRLNDAYLPKKKELANG